MCNTQLRELSEGGRAGLERDFHLPYFVLKKCLAQIAGPDSIQKTMRSRCVTVALDTLFMFNTSNFLVNWCFTY